MCVLGCALCVSAHFCFTDEHSTSQWRGAPGCTQRATGFLFGWSAFFIHWYAVKYGYLKEVVTSLGGLLSLWQWSFLLPPKICNDLVICCIVHKTTVGLTLAVSNVGVIMVSQRCANIGLLDTTLLAQNWLASVGPMFLLTLLSGKAWVLPKIKVVW